MEHGHDSDGYKRIKNGERKMTDLSKQMNDWTKTMCSLDMTRGSEQLLNALARLNLPGVNMDALVASQRDNLEALSASNRAAMEGIKAVAEWQVKILQETVQELTSALGGLAKVKFAAADGRGRDGPGQEGLRDRGQQDAGAC
jgi:hypothetical protein